VKGGYDHYSDKYHCQLKTPLTMELIPWLAERERLIRSSCRQKLCAGENIANQNIANHGINSMVSEKTHANRHAKKISHGINSMAGGILNEYKRLQMDSKNRTMYFCAQTP
jgi:hypothetical protein